MTTRHMCSRQLHVVVALSLEASGRRFEPLFPKFTNTTINDTIAPFRYNQYKEAAICVETMA